MFLNGTLVPLRDMDSSPRSAGLGGGTGAWVERGFRLYPAATSCSDLSLADVMKGQHLS